MIEFIIKAKVYKRLLRIYKKKLPDTFTYYFPLEFMLMAYDEGLLIKYPECFGYPQRNIDKRLACNVMEREGYLIRITKRKRHYKLTLKAEYLCRDFMRDLKSELSKLQINSN